jgi:hypothetical protein
VFFDQQYPVFMDALLVYPDAVFSVLPKASADIKETVVITGGAGSVTVRLTGTTDQKE